MSYATRTSVSVARSRVELEDIVVRYGASGFGSYMQGDRAMVVFEHAGRRVAFVLDLPPREQFRRRKVRGWMQACSPEQTVALWEQSCRERWRALVLVVKAKLEAVRSGITTFEDEFAMHFVLPDGARLRDRLLPELGRVLEGRPLPALLPGLPGPSDGDGRGLPPAGGTT